MNVQRKWLPHRVFASILAITIAAGVPAGVTGATVNLGALAPSPPPSSTSNRITVVAQTSIGNDTETTDIGGFATGALGYTLNGSQILPTDFSYTGGNLSLSDMHFRFLFGIVTVDTVGVHGMPGTIDAPAPVQGQTFPADRHFVFFNQGTIAGGGQTLDFGTTPILVPGQGSGGFSVTSTGTIVNHMLTFDVALSLPVSFSQPFEFMNVPVVGTVTGTLSGSGTIRLSDRFTITLTPGDYDGDGGLGCADIDLLQTAIHQGSSDLAFDANSDGVVNMDDYLSWVVDLKGTLPGDANLDFGVDGSDFNIWNSFKFTSGNGWCDGDFDGDGGVDGSDFNTWNAYKFTHASSTPSVPEPTIDVASLVLLLMLQKTLRPSAPSVLVNSR